MVFRKLAIKDVRKETADCVSISFHIPEVYKEEFRFKQGQNVTIKTLLDGEEIRRTYSICSSPLDNELRIAVKKAASGRFSGYANLHLKKDDVLDVLPPMGKFYTELRADQSKRYLAFAAGSGITPIFSIIKSTLAIETGSSFTLVYGNRTRSAIIFKEELEALKNRYIDRFSIHHILSREPTDAAVYHGRIDAEKCRQLDPLISFAAYDDYFICGPEAMIFSVRAFLEESGVDTRHIHAEFFSKPGQYDATADAGGHTAQEEEQEKKSTVLVHCDGVAYTFELPYNGAFSILEGALHQGADLPYSCKSGICGTCRAKLEAGSVHMAMQYALEPEETEAGFILTCQSYPRSEKVMVDFDAK